MGRSDASYRRLFTHHQLLRDLLACVINDDWLQNLDWAGLEPVETQHVGERLEERLGDGAWRIPYRSGHGNLYVLLLLENQSQPDQYMALRLASYASLLYQTLLRRKMIALPLPPILPVVLYSGKRRWQAHRDLSALIDANIPGLSGYQLQMRYLLINEAELLQAGGLPERNLAALLFRLEHSHSIEQLPELLHTLMQALKGPDFEELDRSFTAYVKYLVLSRAQPQEPAPAVTNLQEIAMLISEKPGMWARQWKREGRREGREKGRMEGREEGRAEGRQEEAAMVLKAQLQRKFGTIPDWAAARIAQADTDTLRQWALNLLDAQRIEDVFENS